MKVVNDMSSTSPVLSPTPIKIPPTVMELQKAFHTHTNKRYDLVVPNIIMDQHSCEMDIVCLRKHGFIDEIEIKVSVEDFMADFKKNVFVSFHDEQQEMLKHDAILYGFMVPNYFSFLITQDMFSLQPDKYQSDYYGLYVAREDSTGLLRVREVRKAPLLHSRKANMLTRYNLSRKLSDKYWRVV